MQADTDADTTKEPLLHEQYISSERSQMTMRHLTGVRGSAVSWGSLGAPYQPVADNFPANQPSPNSPLNLGEMRDP